MMLAAVEAVADADAVRKSRRNDPDVAAQATTGESVHGGVSSPTGRFRMVAANATV